MHMCLKLAALTYDLMQARVQMYLHMHTNSNHFKTSSHTTPLTPPRPPPQ